jgi:hypothetical protein
MKIILRKKNLGERGLAIGLENNGFSVDAYTDPLQSLYSFKSSVYYDLLLGCWLFYQKTN